MGIATPRHVLTAFGVEGPDRGLPGGQGTSRVAGGLVLKPGADPAETAWWADVVGRIAVPGLRIPRPVRARSGALVVDGWSATAFAPGAPVTDDDASLGTWLLVLDAGRSLHHALTHEPRPDFLATRTHRWARADRVAWGEDDARPGPRSRTLLDRLSPLLLQEGLASQVVHGDLSGNVLLDPPSPPAVIDVAPYWRPAAYADAVVVIDALLWWQADPALLEAGRPTDLDRRLWRSFLARGCAFRLLAYDETEPRPPADVDAELARYERLAARLVSL